MSLVSPGAVCAALSIVLGSGNALAQDAQALRTRSLAAACAQCHGTDGRAPAGAAVPGLAGIPAPAFTERMKAFKGADAHLGAVMPQIAKGFSDAQIAQLATYFAGVSRASRP